MTLDELIKAAEVLRDIHGGDHLVGGAKTGRTGDIRSITMNICLTAPPVIVETNDGTKDVLLIVTSDTMPVPEPWFAK